MNKERVLGVVPAEAGAGMNTREAMKALLDGKKIRHKDWGPTEFIAFAPDGVLLDDEGCSVRSVVMYDEAYELYEEPNPHTKGTFAWAREESRRGRHVRCGNMLRAGLSPDIFKKCYFSLSDIDATDWEVVS